MMTSQRLVKVILICRDVKTCTELSDQKCVRISSPLAAPLGFRDQGSSACKHSTCIHTNNSDIPPYAKRIPSNLPKNVVNFCKPTLYEAHTHSRTTVSSVHYAHVHENDLLSASVFARQAPQSASTVRPANTLLLWAPLHPPPAPAPPILSKQSRSQK